MSYLPKPGVTHPGLPKNKLGLTVRDYEGSMSTLCAGCGHDSITAAIIQAFFELEIPPHTAAKLSGIGCSSKTPAYFLDESHGINAIHGRMPPVATGANMANRKLSYIGVSGDGDTLSIGLGHTCHAIRRNVNMLYVIENNGVYGLTKGQFSASAEAGSKDRKGVTNRQAPIDPLLLALSLGATFVARSFSGDKAQLVPLIKAGLVHKGFALLDVYSPCVTFNDHEGSTKSYKYTRQKSLQIVETDFVPPAEEITADYDEGSATTVTMHDGSRLVFRKLDEAYDPTDRNKALLYLQEHNRKGEITTGLLFIDPDVPDLHGIQNTVDRPLNEVPFDALCPGSDMLDTIQAAFR
jgi:2-oxoglutarate ferredoxin oxidoreductase subunit beta